MQVLTVFYHSMNTNHFDLQMTWTVYVTCLHLETHAIYIHLSRNVTDFSKDYTKRQQSSANRQF